MNDDEVEPIRYFRGYPERVKDLRRASTLMHVGCIAPFVFIPSLAVYYYVYAMRNGVLDVRSIGFWLSVGFACLYIAGLITGLLEVRHARIIPYFSRHLGDADTFSRGLAIARHCEMLDELARSRGLTPISRFGFADDMKGEPVLRHNAARGLKTIEGLLALVKSEPRLDADRALIEEDLTHIAKALRKAAEHGVSFSFVIRVGFDRVVSPVEMDARKGSFW